MASAAVLVDKATSELLIGPDWGMNMEICDLINRDPMQSRDVIKAVKKRLGSKNPKVQLLALMLLEALVKNCGMIVHQQVAEKDVLHEMVKIVKRKTDMDVRDKILVLLDSWQEAFGGPGGRLPQFYMAYDELRRMGVDFPVRAPDDAAPIFTPPQTHPVTAYPAPGYMLPGTVSRVGEPVHAVAPAMSLADIEVARGGLEILAEMLNAINSGDRQALKEDIIVELVTQSRSAQQRVRNLINVTTDEEVLRQGLALNDELQHVLAKHDAIASGSSLPLRTPASAVQSLSDHFVENDKEDEKTPQLAHRSSMLTMSTQSQWQTSTDNGQLNGPNVQPALPPSPQPLKKLSPPPGQRVSVMDLLSTLDNDYSEQLPTSRLTPPPWIDSSAGHLVPYEPFQEDETNPFASSPPFKATPLPQSVHTLASQPTIQQHYLQSGFQSSFMPSNSQLAQSSSMASWSLQGGNSVPQQNTPVYDPGVQNPSPSSSNSYPTFAGAGNSHVLHLEQATRAASPGSDITYGLPPPSNLYYEHPQILQQNATSQQPNLQSQTMGQHDPTGGVYAPLEQNNSTYGQTKVMAPPPAAKKNTSSFTTSDKLFDDLVDLHGLTDKLKTSGISNSLSRPSAGRTQ